MHGICEGCEVLLQIFASLFINLDCFQTLPILILAAPGSVDYVEEGEWGTRNLELWCPLFPMALSHAKSLFGVNLFHT